MKRVLVGGAKGRGTFSISDASRLFMARRHKSAVPAGEGSLLAHNRDDSSRKWSRLEQLQSTPKSWREEDSITQERPLSSTPLVDKGTYPTTPDAGPSPLSRSVCVESDQSLADSCLVGRGGAAREAATGVHCRVGVAVQDLKVRGSQLDIIWHFLVMLTCKLSSVIPCPQRVVCEVDSVGSEGAAPGGTAHVKTSTLPLCTSHSVLTYLSPPSAGAKEKLG